MLAGHTRGPASVLFAWKMGARQSNSDLHMKYKIEVTRAMTFEKFCQEVCGRRGQDLYL